MKNKNHFFLLSILLVYVFMNFSSQTVAQTQRNPVLEECTGTWCQWCPCGHDIMEDIKASIPNAIMIGYHGPANGSDPFSFFPGNQILSSFGFSGYPTAVIGRTSGIVSRGTWEGLMNTRNSVPANVLINVNRDFNPNTREFNATIDFTSKRWPRLKKYSLNFIEKTFPERSHFGRIRSRKRSSSAKEPRFLSILPSEVKLWVKCCLSREN